MCSVLNKLVGVAEIDKGHFGRSVLLCVYHYVLRLQIVIGSVRGMDNFQYIHKFDGNSDNLSIFLSW